MGFEFFGKKFGKVLTKINEYIKIAHKVPRLDILKSN
jgi:hypothetical protein